MKKIYFLFILVGSVLTYSCVSKKKYTLSLQERSLFETENLRLKKVDALNQELREELSNCENGVKEMDKLLKDLSDKYTDTRRAFNQLQIKYDDLDNRKDKIVEFATDQRATIHERLIAQEKELESKEQNLEALSERLQEEALKQELLLEAINEREQKIEALKNSLIAQSEILKSLKEKLNKALIGIANADLNVSEKEGKVYISLSQELLYPKGGTTINNKGKDAIRKVAKVLIDNPDIQVNVQGHTDTDGSSEKNWDLSVSRASNIVKYLSILKVDPKRITASGRAYYDPIDSNDNAEGKKRNRRIEIVLSPKLDDIYQFLDRYQY